MCNTWNNKKFKYFILKVLYTMKSIIKELKENFGSGTIRMGFITFVCG